jgi:hypothetical protein
MFDAPRDRLGLLRRAAAHLRRGGRVAVAIVEEVPGGDGAPLPDVREIDEWVYSSLPIETAVEGEEIAIRRLRQTVSPAGVLAEERSETRLRTLPADRLEREGAEAGLVPQGRREIPATELHVGSVVVLFGRGA